MIISLFIDNFATSSNKTYFFLENIANSVTINTDRISTTSFTQIFDDNFFLALSFLQKLICIEKTNLQSPILKDYLCYLRGITTIKLTFRIFGNNYQYYIMLTDKEILKEELYQFEYFTNNNFTQTENGTPIFIRHKKSFFGIEKPHSLLNNELLISHYQNKQTAPTPYYQTHAYFKKELLIFLNNDFINFMANRANADLGKELLYKLQITGSDLIHNQLLHNKILPTELYHINIDNNAVTLINIKDQHNVITIPHHYSSHELLQFYATIHALHIETYRIFCIKDINLTLEPIFCYLLKKIFLSDRTNKYNQLFYTKK